MEQRTREEKFNYARDGNSRGGYDNASQVKKEINSKICQITC